MEQQPYHERLLYSRIDEDNDNSSSSSSPDANFGGWLGFHYNSTDYHEPTSETYGGDTAVVLCLAVLVLLMVSAAVVCFHMDRLRSGRPRPSPSSDGNTVANSVDDLEQGKTEDGDKDVDPPVIILVETAS